MSLQDTIIEALLPEVLEFLIDAGIDEVPKVREVLLELAAKTETKVDDAFANAFCDFLIDAGKRAQEAL